MFLLVVSYMFLDTNWHFALTVDFDVSDFSPFPVNHEYILQVNLSFHSQLYSNNVDKIIIDETRGAQF